MKVSFHINDKMPLDRWRHDIKHHSFLSLNCGGLSDVIYLQKTHVAVCLSVRKMEKRMNGGGGRLRDLLLSPSYITRNGDALMWQGWLQLLCVPSVLRESESTVCLSAWVMTICYHPVLLIAIFTIVNYELRLHCFQSHSGNWRPAPAAIGLNYSYSHSHIWWN